MREDADVSDLVQREIDGENTPEQSAELRRLMTTDPGLAARHAELAALVRALEAIGQEAPPAGLADDVMGALRRLAEERGGRSAASVANRRRLVGLGRVLMFRSPEGRSRWPVNAVHGGGSMGRKGILVAVAAVAAIAIGYFAVNGWPPVDQGAEGTVGAAKRYQAEQIKTEDVILKDAELQQVLQSQAFHRLVNDPAALKAVTSGAFLEAMKNQAARAYFASDAFKAYAASEVARAAAANEAMKAGVASEAARAAAANEATRAGVASEAARQAAANEAMKAGVASEAARAAAANEAMRAGVASEAAKLGVASEALNSFLANPAVMSALSNPAVLNALSDGAFNNAFFKSDMARVALASELARQGAANEAMRSDAAKE